MADHVHHAQFQHFYFVAQHFGLALLQADGAAAVWAAQAYIGQTAGVLFKKIRMILQIVQDFFFV